MLDFLEGLADEPRLIAGRPYLDVRRQRRLDPLEPGHDPIDDGDRVGARLLADRHRDGVFAVQPCLAADFLVRVGDARDVPERDDRAGLRGEHDLLEFPDVAQPAHRAHRELGRTGDEAATGDLGVLAVHRGPDLRHRQTVGVDAIRIQQDADFAPPIAKKRDFSDVLDRFEHLLDLRVGDLGDLFR